ncbi:hypothetical protein LA080_013914 [Diaporthe eres]|nr:hypothetical protein LA080_013914 [Diaporthe eres]
MATADGDVEHLLATKTATPIAQLAPELPDQATRKVHGEVTITWPFSSVSKSVAFLLAEPDFRLRRDKGQVRIQLNGPSAEAVGSLELGSGDEVTLDLDGVEWARDEEPARPPGSRPDWQLKFVGKLTLKVTLGESQETKFIHIDQPVPTEPQEVLEPIPFAEIDTSLFDDEPLIQNNAKPVVNEYASPIFMKRSRASYAPLFDFDLDEELEADGGRKGKGRKRPRYSVQNGRWTYREQSSSPEPEILQNSSSPASAQDGDVVMQDTPSKPQMADGACQTSELELPPPPQSVENTPSKALGRTEPSSLSLSGRPSGTYVGATTDTGVQASTSSLEAATPTQQQPAPTAVQTTTNPFGPVPGTSGFPESNLSFQAGFGMSQAVPHAQSNQQTQRPLTFGENTAPNQPGFGQPTHSQAVLAQPVFGQTVFGQPPSFPGFGQPSNVAAGFGAVGGPPVESVRFGFGEQSQSTFSGMPYASSQTPFSHSVAHYQSEAYPDPQQPSATASPHSHHSSEHALQHSQSQQVFDETHIHAPESHISNHEAPLWPQPSGQWHAANHAHVPEGLHSDSSVPVGTPQGMIPPGVEDGTRNPDEMREQGILSQPVFEQGVSREALPHGRESSADEEDDSMDSDEQADYDEDEKGDDYDMRNYDRISDDEEGFDAERGGLLPDEDLLEEDENFDEDEEDYDDEEDYEEDDYAGGNAYQQPIVQTAPPPQVRKEPIIIDLLSDSDDDEEQAPPPPKSQLVRQKLDGIAKSEPERHLVAGALVSNVQLGQRSVEAEQESEETDESAEEEEEEDGEGESLPGDEPLVDENGSSKSESDGASGNDGDMDVDEPTNAGASNDVEPTSDIEVPYRPIVSVPEVEEAADVSPGQSRSQSEVDEGSDIEEITAKVSSTAEKTQQAQQETGKVLGEDDAMSEDGHEANNRVESPQPEPIELPATFQTQSGDVAASFETQVMDSNAAVVSSSPLGRPPSSETLHTHPVDLNASFQTQTGDVAASFQSQVLEPVTSPNLPSSPPRQEPVPGAAEDTLMDDDHPDGTDEHRNSGSGEDASDEDMNDDGAGETTGPEPRLSDDEPVEGGTNEMDITPNIQNEASESKSFEGFSDDPQEAPPSPPESQHREGRVTRSMDVSMTTVSSHVETQVTDKEVAIIQTQDTEVVLSQPEVSREEKELSVGHERVATTAEEAVSAPEELESDAESIKDGRAASHEEAQLDENEDLAMSEAASEPLENEIVAASSPAQPADPEEAEEPKTTGVAVKEVAHALSDEEDFHDASELLQMDESPSVAHFDDRASFVTANSQASESRETEEADSPSLRKSKRNSRIRALREESNIQFAKPPRGSKRGSRVPSDQSPSPRTTRSQKMSFQKAESPTHEQEDMFARAGLRSPSRRKASATSANKAKNKTKPKDDLVKRLGSEMPECAPLKDLKSYNMNTLDIAAVVTSTNTTPQRTKARQYVSSFTISDPSTAPEGVIEVSLFRAHKDYLPVVKPGDSILLRHFMVTSLPDRGFGLRTEDESSWAVFNTDGEDATPQVRGPPVELSEKEKSYLLDLRAWYAALDEGAKEKLAEAVGEMVQKGKESRGEK